MNKKECYRPQSNYPEILNWWAVKLLFRLFLPLFVVLKFIFYIKLCGRAISSDNYFLISSDKGKKILSKHKEGLNGTVFEIDVTNKEYFLQLNFWGHVSVLFSALKLSICNVRVRYVLYYHDLYELLAFSFFIRNISNGKIYFTNHYDRWSIIIDRVSVVPLVQLQHGIVSDSYFPTFKLLNVNEVFCYDDVSEVIWRENICANKKAKYNRIALDVELNYSCDNNSVFIISNPLYFDDELALLSLLVDSGEFNVVLFKPHPLYDYQLDRLPKATCILGKYDYPDARIIITKGSTLGREYESLGKKVIWWEGSSVECIYNRVINEINL